MPHPSTGYDKLRLAGVHIDSKYATRTLETDTFAT